jgi:hypothetical protein
MSLKNTSACLGYQQITSLATSTGLTVPSDQNRGIPTLAVIQAEAQAVRWRDDGVAPTASVGMVLAAGASMEYDGTLGGIRFIEATGGAILNVTYRS